MLEGKTEDAGEGFTSLVLGQVMEVILPIRLENVPPVNNMILAKTKTHCVFHSSYLICFTLAYHGPNAGVLGNVGNSYWHYEVGIFFHCHV